MTACHHRASSLQGKGTKHHVGSVTTTPNVSHASNGMTGNLQGNWGVTVKMLRGLLASVNNVAHVVGVPLKGNPHPGMGTVSRWKQSYGV